MGSTLGACRTEDKLPDLLNHLLSLLNEEGQLLIEDANIEYKSGFNKWSGVFKYKNYESTEFEWINFSARYLLDVLSELGLVAEQLVTPDFNRNFLIHVKI